MRKITHVVIAFVIATGCSASRPVTLRAQQSIDSAELVASVNRTIVMRLDWLRDTIPIDGCSILLATRDPKFIPRIHAGLREHVDTSGLSDCQRVRKHTGPYVEILDIRVQQKDTVRYVAVRQMLRNAPVGSSIQTFYLHPAASFIEIEQPAITTDKGNGPGRPPPPR